VIFDSEWIQRAREAAASQVTAIIATRSAYLASALIAPASKARREVKESLYGPIPAHWDLREIQEVCTRVVDCPHTTPQFVPSGVLVIRNFNLRSGELDLTRAYYTSEEEYRERVARETPQAGDVIFSREAPVGEACVLPSGVTASLGQRTMLLRPDRQIVDPEYLLGVLYSPAAQEHMKLQATSERNRCRPREAFPRLRGYRGFRLREQQPAAAPTTCSLGTKGGRPAHPRADARFPRFPALTTGYRFRHPGVSSSAQSDTDPTRLHAQLKRRQLETPPFRNMA
jgi:hypothetical protein